MRRLTNNEHLNSEFATRWPEYDLDPKTRTLLAYATKLTKEPFLMDDSDMDKLRAAGWDDKAIYAATVLVSFYNFTGRLEAASGLPEDNVPQGFAFAESIAD